MNEEQKYWCRCCKKIVYVGKDFDKRLGLFHYRKDGCNCANHTVGLIDTYEQYVEGKLMGEGYDRYNIISWNTTE